MITNPEFALKSPIVMQGYQEHGHGDGPDHHGGRGAGQLLYPLRPG